MYRLKLARGLSYTGHGVRATAKEPYVETEDKAAAVCLVESKHFELAANAQAESGSFPDDGAPSEKWTLPQLQAFAAEKGIDVTGLKLKPEFLAKVQEALLESRRISFGENE